MRSGHDFVKLQFWILVVFFKFGNRQLVHFFYHFWFSSDTVRSVPMQSTSGNHPFAIYQRAYYISDKEVEAILIRVFIWELEISQSVSQSEQISTVLYVASKSDALCGSNQQRFSKQSVALLLMSKLTNSPRESIQMAVIKKEAQKPKPRPTSPSSGMRTSNKWGIIGHSWSMRCQVRFV